MDPLTGAAGGTHCWQSKRFLDIFNKHLYNVSPSVKQLTGCNPRNLGKTLFSRRSLNAAALSPTLLRTPDESVVPNETRSHGSVLFRRPFRKPALSEQQKLLSQ